jgi:hypothetical protein
MGLLLSHIQKIDIGTTCSVCEQGPTYQLVFLCGHHYHTKCYNGLHIPPGVIKHHDSRKCKLCLPGVLPHVTKLARINVNRRLILDQKYTSVLERLIQLQRYGEEQAALKRYARVAKKAIIQHLQDPRPYRVFEFVVSPENDDYYALFDAVLTTNINWPGYFKCLLCDGYLTANEEYCFNQCNHMFHLTCQPDCNPTERCHYCKFLEDEININIKNVNIYAFMYYMYAIEVPWKRQYNLVPTLQTHLAMQLSNQVMHMIFANNWSFDDVFQQYPQLMERYQLIKSPSETMVPVLDINYLTDSSFLHVTYEDINKPLVNQDYSPKDFQDKEKRNPEFIERMTDITADVLMMKRAKERQQSPKMVIRLAQQSTEADPTDTTTLNECVIS